jgi:hypothetical protein
MNERVPRLREGSGHHSCCISLHVWPTPKIWLQEQTLTQVFARQLKPLIYSCTVILRIYTSCLFLRECLSSWGFNKNTPLCHNRFVCTKRPMIISWCYWCTLCKLKEPVGFVVNKSAQSAMIADCRDSSDSPQKLKPINFEQKWLRRDGYGRNLQ